jgi:hypothetical protein
MTFPGETTRSSPTSDSAKRVTDPVLIQSVAVVVSESGEGGLGFPGHVGVGVAETVLQDFDHSPAGHVEVFAGVAAVRQAVADEGAREGGGDALGGEDVQQLAQVGGLLLLIADVVAVEPDRGDPVVLDDLSASGAVVSRAAMGGATELGDRDRLALGDQCADALLVDVGDFLRAVEVDRDDVERSAGNAVETESGVVPDTLDSQGSFVLRGFFGAIELHTRFPFEHFLPQTRQ